MSGHPFVLVDVFGQDRYSGNPLAVFPDAGGLTSGEMQAIAREINFSETAFVLPGGGPVEGYDVRIFTPGEEVDFAGHPTLGAAEVVRARRPRTGPVDRVVLNLRAGRVPVTFPDAAGGDLLWMRQVPPVFRPAPPGPAAAAALGLPASALDERWPVEQVSTGLHHIVVPLRSLDDLRRARIDRAAYDRLVEAAAWAKVLLAFVPSPRDPGHDVSARVFPVALGIPEDPATGSGAGCLGAYFVRHRIGGRAEARLRIGQGHEMGRPSLLHVRAREDADGRIEAEVGGRVIFIAEGLWG